MSAADIFKPGVHFMIVRHDPWCPMAHGEGMRCASGCNPVTEVVDEAAFTARLTSDLKNRAERRAAAKAARGAAK